MEPYISFSGKISCQRFEETVYRDVEAFSLGWISPSKRDDGSGEKNELNPCKLMFQPILREMREHARMGILESLSRETSILKIYARSAKPNINQFVKNVLLYWGDQKKERSHPTNGSL